MNLRSRFEVTDSPWGAEALARLLTADAVALVLLTVGWYQVSGAITVGHQLSWLECGLLGLGVEGVAGGLWLYRGRRAVGMARVALLGGYAGAEASRPQTRTAQLVAGAGLAYFHRDDCALVRQRDVQRGDRAEFEHDGLTPCEISRP